MSDQFQEHIAGVDVKIEVTPASPTHWQMRVELTKDGKASDAWMTYDTEKDARRTADVFIGMLKHFCDFANGSPFNELEPFFQEEKQSGN